MKKTASLASVAAEPCSIIACTVLVEFAVKGIYGVFGIIVSYCWVCLRGGFFDKRK
jgi:hypothetical protein